MKFDTSDNVPSFLFGSKTGKNALGAMTSVRPKPRGRMKRKDLFSLFLTCPNILFLKIFLKICTEYNIAADFSTKFHSEKIRK